MYFDLGIHNNIGPNKHRWVITKINLYWKYKAITVLSRSPFDLKRSPFVYTTAGLVTLAFNSD